MAIFNDQRQAFRVGVRRRYYGADHNHIRRPIGEEFYNLLEFRPVAIDVVEVGTISRLAQRLHENHRPERWRICGCGPNGGSTDYYVHDFI